MATAPVEYLTPAVAGHNLCPDNPEFWVTAPCWAIRDAALESSHDPERLAWWEIILEVRLAQDFNMTLLHDDGTPRDLETLDLGPSSIFEL